MVEDSQFFLGDRAIKKFSDLIDAHDSRIKNLHSSMRVLVTINHVVVYGEINSLMKDSEMKQAMDKAEFTAKKRIYFHLTSI